MKQVVTFTSEKAVVRAAKKGDQAAFETLYKNHSDRIRRICWTIVKDGGVAEEMTQETFVRGFTKIKMFKGTCMFGTWLTRIAINMCKMHIRKKKSTPQHLELSHESSELEMELESKITVDDPHLLGTIDRLELNAALKKLHPMYRTAFLLNHMGGYTCPELAKMTNTGLPAFKSRVLRAREFLQRELRGYADARTSAETTR